MSDRITLLPLARIEGTHLARLVDEFRELLTTSRPEEDPAVARLVPDAYPDDLEASLAFSEGTQGDLLDRRTRDAAVVRSALEPFLTPIENEDDALTPIDVVIPDADFDAWLRTLSAMRLVMASRLGIAAEDAHDPEDPRFGVYDWLGYRLDGLLTAIEDGH